MAQVKGGIYADASAALVGSAVFEKGKDPQFNLDGSLNLSIGIMLGFYSRLYAKTSLGNFGYDAELSKKWELLSWGLSSVGCSGVIKEPSQRIGGEDMPLSEVKVTLKKDSSIVKYATTDAGGTYKFGIRDDGNKGLTPGVYKLTAKKNGYREVKQDVAVTVNDTGEITIDPIQMVEGVYGNCTITGYIYDLVTGKTTGAALELTLCSGINDASAVVLDKQTIGADGAYSCDVQGGNYTITVKDLREGIDDNQRYHTASFTATAVNGKTTQKNRYVSQAANDDQIRIVLTWGASPSDLDSHLLGLTGDGSSRFHTYYSNKSCKYNGKTYADLDLDDISAMDPKPRLFIIKTEAALTAIMCMTIQTGELVIVRRWLYPEQRLRFIRAVYWQQPIVYLPEQVRYGMYLIMMQVRES